MAQAVLAVATLATAAPVWGQRTYSPNFSIGGRAGATLSNASFTPKVEQGMLPGVTASFVARYTEEKWVGVMAELNVAQRGWREKYEADEPFSYERRLTYLSIPVMTHVFFGSRRVKCFINLGPEIGFLLGSSTKANFDYMNPTAVKDYPAGRETFELYEKVHSKVDYGITAGLGGEFRITPRHSVMLEARYYFGLGNLYPNTKKDVFSGSRVNSIEVTVGYLYRIK